MLHALCLISLSPHRSPRGYGLFFSSSKWRNWGSEGFKTTHPGMMLNLQLRLFDSIDFFFNSSPEDMFLLILEKRERNIDAREKHWLVVCPKWESNPQLFLCMRWCSNQRSPTDQGWLHRSFHHISLMIKCPDSATEKSHNPCKISIYVPQLLFEHLCMPGIVLSTRNSEQNKPTFSPFLQSHV